MSVSERSSLFVVGVENSHISQTLDRLADMIKNPSFPKQLFFEKIGDYSGTFESLLKDEEFLFQCIFRDVSLEDEVFRRMNILTDKSITESKETSEINLLEHVKNFFKTHYSSNIMTLVISSGEPLSKIYQSVISTFSFVKNLHISRPLPLDLARVVRHPHLGTVGNVIHTKSFSQNELILEFPIDYQEVLWDSSPSQYLVYLLKDNSNLSLNEFLISKGWILKMDVSMESHKYSFSSFEIRFSLTSKGLEKIKSIIQATFIALEHIKTTPIKQELLVEIQQILKFKFDYHFNVSPKEITNKIIDSFDIKGCSPEEVLIAGNLIRNSNLEEVSAFMDKISHRNLVIFIKHTDFTPEGIDILGKDPGLAQSLEENSKNTDKNRGVLGAVSELGTEGQKNEFNSEPLEEPKDLGSDSSSSEDRARLEFRKCPNFNAEYYIEELSEKFLDEIDEAIDFIKPRLIRFKIRKKNKLLGNTPLQYFSSNANYRQYSPTLLKSAVLDYLSGEKSFKLTTFYSRVRENVQKPLFSSFYFFNNVSLQAPSATFYIRIMVPGPGTTNFDSDSGLINDSLANLENINSARELILSLEVLVACLKYSADGIIKNMQNIGGVFSVKSNLGSEFKGVPFGLEIMIRGYLGSIFIALKSFSRFMLHLRRHISAEKFDQIILSLKSRIKAENINRSSGEEFYLVLKTLFEAQKVSMLTLQDDFSSVSLEQVLELSTFLSLHGVHEGAIIGNIDPLQAYTILNQFVNGVRYNDLKDSQPFSQLSSIRDSMQSWRFLDPFSLPEGENNWYFYNPMGLDSSRTTSSSLLYIPFSHLNKSSIAFQLIFDYLVGVISRKISSSDVEIDMHPKINDLFLAGFTLSCLSESENVVTLSERLLENLHSLIKFISGIRRDQFENIKKVILSKYNLASDAGQFETKILYQVVSRRDILGMMQGIKTSTIMIDHQEFIKFCKMISRSPKFLISNQKIVPEQELKAIQNYIPEGFLSITGFNQLTDSDSCKFIQVPFRFIDG
ncbi:peptidase M16 inactive domain-containing protein [Cryptosporidium felis]|nr:peptidase M16 inactive domain-containing protein [Cryptosporidium felis]